MKNITLILFFACIHSIAFSQLADSSQYYYINLCSYKNAIRCYEKKLKTIKNQHPVEKSVDYYNLATCYTLNGDKDVKKIIKNIEASFKADSATKKILLSDASFYKLIDNPVWKKFILKTKWQTNFNSIENDSTFYLLYRVAVQDQVLYNEINCVERSYGVNSTQEKKIWELKDSLNNENQKILKSFLNANINVLSNKMVGETFADKCFLVIQHSDAETMTSYLPIIEELYKKGETRGENYALLYDRVSLLKPDGKQYYGTQVNDMLKKPFPIRDERNVDKRRRELGMITLESYLSKFGIHYKYKP